MRALQVRGAARPHDVRAVRRPQVQVCSGHRHGQIQDKHGSRCMRPVRQGAGAPRQADVRAVRRQELCGVGVVPAPASCRAPRRRKVYRVRLGRGAAGPRNVQRMRREKGCVCEGRPEWGMKCAGCRAEARPGRTRCAPCAAKANATSAVHRAGRRSAGRCVSCGGAVEAERAGRTECARCSRNRLEKYGRKTRKYMNDLLASREAAGVCVQCGVGVPRPGRKSCAACAAKRSEYGKNLAKARAAAGRCTRCGGAKDAGRRTRRMCAACAASMSAKTAARRAGRA